VTLGVFVLPKSLVPITFGEQPARSPGRALPDRVVEFTSYDDPTFGYRVAVPKQARTERSSDGRTATFIYDDASVIGGTYRIEVSALPTSGQSARDLLTRDTVAAIDASAISETSANGGQILGVMRSYALPATPSCPARRGVAAAFVRGSDGFVLRIESDASGRCDAERVADTKPVIDSLRLSKG
jgi:hypothetical protein